MSPRDINIEGLHGRIRKPVQPGAFTLELTPEQQEKLAKLCSETGTEIKGLEVELLEGKIAPAAVLFGLVA